jgi:tetratricopeptide (TPR) repeat protein
MTGKKKSKTILIAVATLILVGAGVYGYMNMEKLEVLVKKSTGSNTQDLLALAQAAEQSGDNDKALGYYQGFIDVNSDAPANTDPNVGIAYASMGNIYLKQFKYNEATEYLKKGLDHSTQHGGKDSTLTAEHWYSLASIYDKQGEVKTALEHYKNSRAILVKLDVDTGKVDKMIDELEDYMVNASLHTSSTS